MPTSKNASMGGDGRRALFTGVIAAAASSPSAGAAVAGLPSARTACRKTCGACPATESPGSARIVMGRTGSAISKEALAKRPLLPHFCVRLKFRTK